jgi:biopolymer transport protein ExbD
MKQIAGDATVHHVSQRTKRGRLKPKMAPPLTPMIDVTFLLLLYFLLTINFR